MIANYVSNYPFLNNFGNATIYKAIQESDTPLVKAKAIGWDGLDAIGMPDVFEAEYHTKKYYSQSVSLFFKSWTFEQFEEQYQGQVALMEETLVFLKKIKRWYQDLAEKQTREQYADLFFQDNIAFPVADIYFFFNWKGDKQIKNQQAFQKILDKNIKTEEFQELQELEEGNLDFFEEEPEDIIPMKWQTGPINIKIQYKDEPNLKDDTVVVDFDEIIKISGYTFSPIIRGVEQYIPWQEQVIYDTNRFITVVGSRQWGKSHVMALRALTSSFKGYRHDTLVCAFLAETTGHIYKYLTRLIENFPEWTFVESKQKWWITNTMTGSRIIFRSLSKEADRIRWWTLHEVIMDECYLIDDSIFESVILPTLSTTGGSVCMISTPGPKNWFYWEVMKGKQGETGYSYYQFTILDNPFIVPEERERIMKKQNDPVIRREWFCEFDDMANQVFRPTKTSDLSYYTNHKDVAYYVFAYDPARKGNDRAGYTCFMVYNGKVFVIKSWFIPDQYKSTWEWQFKWMEENIFNEHDYDIVMDATGVGDGVVALLQQKRKVHMGLQYVSGNTESEDMTFPYGAAKAMRVGKSRLINNTQNYLDEGLTSFYSYTNEYLFYEMDGITEKRTSMWFVSFTTKGFDDITNSLMIGLYYIEYEGLLNKKRIVEKQKVDNIFEREPYLAQKQETQKHRGGWRHW